MDNPWLDSVRLRPAVLCRTLHRRQAQPMPEFAIRQLALWARAQAMLGMEREALAVWAIEAGFKPEQAHEALDLALAQCSFEPAVQSPIELPASGFWSMPEGIDCRMWMKVPRIALFDGVIDAQEAELIVEAAMQGLSPSLVAGGTPAPGRSSFSCSLAPGKCPAADKLRGTLAELLGVGLDRFEPLQATRYGGGGFYAPHYDHFPEGHPRATARQRVATFVVYLREPDGGGQTVVEPLGLSVAPRAGSALYFAYPDVSSRELCLHASKPCRGVKWVATQWVVQA